MAVVQLEAIIISSIPILHSISLIRVVARTGHSYATRLFPDLSVSVFLPLLPPLPPPASALSTVPVLGDSTLTVFNMTEPIELRPFILPPDIILAEYAAKEAEKKKQEAESKPRTPTRKQ